VGDVRFTNNYFTTVYVSYMWHDPACGANCGDPWNVAGWVNLRPGETQTRPNPTSNRWFYYFAEADDHKLWGGNVIAGVGKGVFLKCRCQPGDPPFFYNVGMRELDLSEFGGVTFVR
jgi:hypothetical protein